MYGKGVGARVKLKEIPWDQTGAAQNAQAKAEGLSLNRIEDGHFDPMHPNDFYFVTTVGGQAEGSGLDTRDGGGLWRLRFDDVEKPLKGATLTLLLDGGETVGAGEPKLNNPDNMTIDTAGNLLIQEDPGNNNHIARIVAYRITDGALGVVARFDPALFGPGATADPTRLTTDEESSGIIDAKDLLGPGTFIFDAQIHTTKNLPTGTGPNTVQEYVENGQLLTLKVADFAAVYGA
jgi:Alkaline phosphatase PhoX